MNTPLPLQIPIPHLPATPPPRPVDPQDAALYDIKKDLISIMQLFKVGLFKDRITWSLKLVDFFDILLVSPALDRDEKVLLARVAYQVQLFKEAPNLDNWKLNETRLENHRTMELLRAMVAVECAARGDNALTGWLRSRGMDDLSFEVDLDGFGPAGPVQMEQNIGDFPEPPEICNRPMARTQMPSFQHTAYGNLHRQASLGLLPMQTLQFSGMPQTAPGSFQQPSPFNSFHRMPLLNTGFGSMNNQNQAFDGVAVPHVDDTGAGPSGNEQGQSQSRQSPVQAVMNQAWGPQQQPH